MYTELVKFTFSNLRMLKRWAWWIKDSDRQNSGHYLFIWTDCSEIVYMYICMRVCACYSSIYLRSSSLFSVILDTKIFFRAFLWRVIWKRVLYWYLGFRFFTLCNYVTNPLLFVLTSERDFIVSMKYRKFVVEYKYILMF